MTSRLIIVICLLLFACAPTSIPSTPVDSPDAELDAAIKKAQDSLDTFVEKISTPNTGRTFVALKVRFSTPHELPQDIWVDEVSYSNGVFRGSVGDDIPALKLTLGETITVKEEDILDWMIVEDGKLIGGYTIRLALQRMSPEEREQFLETLDYSIEE